MGKTTKKFRGTAFAIAMFALAMGVASPLSRADGLTRVFLNGQLVPVSFNDGDSFRVQSGQFSGSQCRLAGFNTLESFGPGHQWGTWHPYELYINAKMATNNGRRGTWHCNTDGSRDGYGRLLVTCPDLIMSQISQGFAHAYTIDDSPAPAEYLRAQQEAIAARRGFWAHGVPEFIMTSAHSASEDPGRPTHSNRLISTRDGHTEMMRHHDVYNDCDWVCSPEVVVDETVAREVARRLREDATLAPELASYSNLILIEFVVRFVRSGNLPSYLAEPLRASILAKFSSIRESGLWPTTQQSPGSCFLYIDFRRRYGRERASCLMGHGTVPAHMQSHFHGAHQ